LSTGTDDGLYRFERMDILQILRRDSLPILSFFNNSRTLAAEPRPCWISRASLRLAAVFFVIALASLPSYAQTSILTQHYDISRTGQNTAETILTTSNVNSASFGKLFWIPVTGYVYAQPLYVPGVVIPGNGTHNVLYVATEHDQLYAFDADNGAQLWQVNFLINGATTVTTNDVGGTQDINPEMGITGTPTIDPVSKTLYVVVNTVESGNIIYRLHAIDITTGAEKFGGPVLMSGSVPGTAPDGNGSTVPFNPQWANQRPGLLLLNGYLYVGFSSHGDNGPWHGWILAYNASSLSQTGIWCTSPNGKGNGIWGAGSGLTADAEGYIYVATGNGDDTVTTPAPPPSTTIDYGDSIVKVGLTNGVPVPTDYFTPYNQAALDDGDTDLGSGGVLALPDPQPGPYPHILIQSGKQGEIYVVNRDKLTSDGSHYCNGCSSDPEIIQSLTSATGGLWSMPAYWNSQVYLWGNGGHLVAYSLTNGMLSQTPTSTSAESSNFPGSTPVVSSNGTSNGIVWAVESDAYNSQGPAILRAYSAANVSNILYGSNLTSGRDTLGPAVKFVVPVVTNGKVYVGAENEVDVFGLTAGWPQAAAPSFSPAAGSYNGGIQVTMSSTTPNATIYYTTNGNTPTSTSPVYTGPVSVTDTTTFNAVTTANGFLQSAASTATYTVQSQTAPPNISPAAGTYNSSQTIQLSDTTPNAIIYYTTDGSTPNHNSKQYSTPISVTATTTISAIASSPSLNDSPVVVALFTINPDATTINFGMGFATPTGMQFNGSTDLDDSRLQLTNGAQNEAGSAFFNSPTNITDFTTDFTFQLSDAQADGITFTIQNSAAGPTALGPSGGGLGYGPDTPGGTPGISNSVAVKYDLYSNDGEGDDSTGLYTNGASPTVPATDMTSSGVILNSGDTMTVHITYDGATLTMTITDYSVNATFTTSWPINIPQTIGSNTAYVGFTGGTGGLTASQKIETWTFASTPTGTQVQTPVITPGSESFTGPLSVSITDGTSGSSIYYTTDGSTPSPGQGTTQQYSTSLTLDATTVVNAIATAPSDTNSAMATETYTLLSQPAAKPTISPNGGKISTTQPVSIGDTSNGAGIYFTTDGSTPSPGVGTTQQYSTPFTLPASAVVKAIATGNGYTASAVAVASYTVQRLAAPALSPKGGPISTTQQISISDSTGATIYYTTDGTVPSPGIGTTRQYGGPFSLTSAGVVKAIATEAAYENSTITSASYTLQKVATPTYSPKSGTISTTQPIMISETTSGATIYYTTDGSTPSPGIGTTKKYSSTFTLSASATVKAIAIANGYLDSSQANISYACQRAVKPTVTPAGGAISPTQTITINDTTTGAQIYYTTDGSTPSPGVGTTKQYSSSFTLSSSATVKTIATAAGYVNSPMTSTTYTVK
jgi:Legume lectin domain/Chitobiase/beta-hexosaminidase C-terminal domain/Fn3 associated